MTAQFGRPADAAHFLISYSPADERWATWIAWELELAGYRTVLQAWDFVPGTNFIDFMDRAIRQSAAVIAVLSNNYLRSRYGRLEWQAAFRSSPDDPQRRLITVRIEDFDPDGLLATITYVDLVGAADERDARQRLLRRVGEAMRGRAKPTVGPGFPAGPTAARRDDELPAGQPPPQAAAHHPRLRMRHPPAYPPQRSAARAANAEVTLLHLPGPRFARQPSGGSVPHQPAKELLEALSAGVERLLAAGGARPDALLISGNLTAAGGIREFDEALTFLTRLRGVLDLDVRRIAVVPGPRDVNHAACRAYFASCEADEVTPQPPYWDKWRHYFRFFAELYDGVDGPTFDRHRPWSVFEMPDLSLVVAGINSTMAESHRPDDHYGLVGDAQARWFARHLDRYRSMGWLTAGLIGHAAEPAAADAVRDHDSVSSLLVPRLHLIVSPPGPCDGGADCDPTLIRLSTGAAGDVRSRVIASVPVHRPSDDRP
ncbi:TIR domain-containing protein [Micromonospora sp. KC207]|uniref:toll/interleukin-1 receptor domain-containing protein n=1 Tax=Micromonospora sp. KC207 TaxID=2530377 RepID=UPI0010E56EA0|nr:toll/interleukin-1 receptor domain-containing protein [Micromonospora sp. KC207]TDC59159.1 TIR domain-containing protein [Micromonospora sp. KC207]